MNGFDPEPMPSSGLLSRIVRTRRRECGLQSIRNLLAATPLECLDAETIRGLCSDAGITWDRDREAIRGIYSVVVRHCASDGLLSADEKRGLAALRDGVEFPLAFAAGEHERIAHEIYRAKVAEALADGELTTTDTATLALVAESLEVPASNSEAILGEECRKVLQFALSASISDRRWSVDEERRFLELARRMGVRVTHDQATKDLLGRYRMLWQITQGELPEDVATIRLAPKEVCHATEWGTRHEVRSVTSRVNFGGPTVRIPVGKYFSFRAGSIAFDRVRADRLTPLDTGRLILTNRRLVFDGEHNTTTIQLAKISKFALHADGLHVEKSSGRDQWFTREGGDWEKMAACLDVLLSRE